jgi:hypothetical protein
MFFGQTPIKPGTGAEQDRIMVNQTCLQIALRKGCSRVVYIGDTNEATSRTKVGLPEVHRALSCAKDTAVLQVFASDAESIEFVASGFGETFAKVIYAGYRPFGESLANTVEQAVTRLLTAGAEKLRAQQEQLSLMTKQTLLAVAKRLGDKGFEALPLDLQRALPDIIELALDERQGAGADGSAPAPRGAGDGGARPSR